MTKKMMSLDQVREIGIKGQLPEFFGLDIIELRGDSLTAQLKVDERHLRPGNIMNGGVSLVLIETVASMSSFLFIDPVAQNTFGIQVSANHLAIAHPGDILTATSLLVHAGKTTQVWDVVIKNQNNKTISSGRVTLLVTNK